MRLTCTVRLKTGSNMAVYLSQRSMCESVICVQSDVRMRIAGAGRVPDKPVVIVYKCMLVCHMCSPSGVSRASL